MKLDWILSLRLLEHRKELNRTSIPLGAHSFWLKSQIYTQFSHTLEHQHCLLAASNSATFVLFLLSHPIAPRPKATLETNTCWTKSKLRSNFDTNTLLFYIQIILFHNRDRYSSNKKKSQIETIIFGFHHNMLIGERGWLKLYFI